MSLSELKFTVYGTKTITEEVLTECAALFSNHYGKWGEKGSKPGNQVSLSSKRLRSQYLFDETCFAITAQNSKDKIIGHAFYCQFPFLEGKAAWVTQLVVHKEYRSKGIAKQLLSKTWSPENLAWGLVTSHPHAVRALEAATSRLCIPQIISKYAPVLMKATKIPYIQNCETTITGTQSVIHSEFFVDHSEVNELVKKDEKWSLATLADGDEFFAFTFK